MNSLMRTEMLIGREALAKLKDSWVAIFGIGGVGSYSVEGLARSGVGKFTLVDNDNICETNINRQIHAVQSTLGKPKVDVMKERILDINPDAVVETFQVFYSGSSSEQLINKNYTYIVDAIDTVPSKIDLIVGAKERVIPIISSMGTGNKIYPDRLRIDDIFNTSVCPLARIIRKELRKRDIESLKVIYSAEEPIKPLEVAENCCRDNNEEEGKNNIIKREAPGSMSFVPSAAGLMIAGEVIRDIIGYR